MNYSDLVAYLGETFQVQYEGNTFLDDTSNTILPRVIDLAEQRIYTAMNFLASRQTNSNYSTGGTGYALTAGSRNYTLPTTCIILEGVSVITPVTANPETGARNFVDLVSLDFVDFMYPTASTVKGVPLVGALKTDQALVFGPTPDQAYPLEVTGMFRPSPISQTNTTTYISLNYPQLLMAACAISWAGYQRDYGAQSDDPKLALSWKVEYQEFLDLAISEEKRRRGLTEETAKTAPQEPGA